MTPVTGQRKWTGSDEREDYLVTGTAQSDTLTGNDGNDTINAGAGKDIVKGGAGDDSLAGGTGQDTLTGGDGEDIFVYASGDGNDVITDYIAGEDKIHFKSGTPKFKVNGSDVVITVGSGKITVKGAADRVITYIDSKGKEKTWPDSIDIDDETNTVILSKDYMRTSFNLAGYADDIQTVDASAVTRELSITGNSAANRIIGSEEDDVIDGGAGKDTLLGGDGNDSLNGGKGNDILIGGAGNDTYTGGAGADIFVYSKGQGKDVITDYDEDDKVSIASGSEDDFDITTSGNDVVLTFNKNNKITVKDAADKDFTYIVDGVEKILKVDDPIEYNTKGTAATLTSAYSDEEFKFSESEYPKKLATLNAASVAHDLSITGNSLANKITGTDEDDTIDGGKGKDTIYGGDGNDIIYGGAGNDLLFGGAGEDTFVFKSGEGNDVISDYKSEDFISISSGSVDYAGVSGNDLLYKIGKGTLTVKGAAGSNVHFIGSDGKDFYLPERLINEIKIASNGKGATLSESFSADELNANTHAELKNFVNNLVTIDASAASHGIAITGTKNKNYIIGGEDDDTIIGGKGADTLKGGEGSDVFVYKSGDGNDKILDYSEEDIIQFTSGTAKAKTSGDNVIFTLGSGKITVMGGKNHVITYEDSEGTKTYPANPLTINAAGTGATLKSTYRATTFDATTNAYVSEVSDILKTINGSQVTHDIEIIGNAKANRIIGGTENDTLYGGKGNDTLTGGEGEDVFVYNSGDGKDVITDYAPGEDVINFATGTVSSVGRSGNDVVFKVSSGSLTVKNAKNKIVTYIEGDEEKTYPANSSRPYTVSSDGESVTLASTYTTRYGNAFDVTDFDDMSNVRRIDATKVEADLVVKGNNKNNLIYCSGGDNTIYGGKGNDTINGGEGNNRYVYNSGDGNDLIIGWGSSDSISIASGNLSGDFRSTDDTVILTVGKGKISLQGAVGEQLNYWYDGEAHHTIVGANANVLEDDNFITSNDLSALVENKAVDYSAAQASDITSLTKSNNALPSLSYSKKK